jgi:hypothetical protein
MEPIQNRVKAALAYLRGACEARRLIGAGIFDCGSETAVRCLGSVGSFSLREAEVAEIAGALDLDPDDDDDPGVP